MSSTCDVASMALCRTCLTSSDLLPLFPVSGPAARARLQYDLRRATGLPISMDDGLPQKICRKCTDLVCSALYLQDQSLLSEKKLLNLGYQVKQEFVECADSPQSASEEIHCDKTDINFNKGSLTIISILEESKENIEKPYNMFNEIKTEEPSQSSEPSAIIPQDHTIYLDSDDTVIENVATVNESAKQESLKQLKHLSKIKVCEEYSDGPLNQKGPIRCNKCKRLSKCLSSFYFHIRIHNDDHVCEFCGKKFSTAIGLKRHCMSWHGMEKEQACTKCDYRTTGISRLREHMRTHTGEKPFECAECGGKYHSRSLIIQHLRTHVSKTLPCDKCASKFKTRRALTTHMNQAHIRDYVYLCYMCDMKYTKNSTVRNHLTKFHRVPREEQGKIPRFSRSKFAIVN